MPGAHIFRVLPSPDAFRDRVAGRFAGVFANSIGERAAGWAFSDADRSGFCSDADVGS